MLAFALERLAHGLKRGDRLTHQCYDRIGGVKGALQRQGDKALDEACTKAGVRRDQVLSALLDLVTIDGEGRWTKRRVVLDKLSNTIADELKPFVDRRLLSTEADADGEYTSVGVAHEAFLVNWQPLKDEIDVEAGALRARGVVETAARAWAEGGRDESALLQDRQLAKATVDLGAQLKPIDKGEGILKRLSPAAGEHLLRILFWREMEPSNRRLVTRVDLDEVGRAFLEASMRADRARLSRRRAARARMVAVIVTLVLISLSSAALYVIESSARRRVAESEQQAVAYRLILEADMMANRGVVEDEWIQRALAARALDPAAVERFWPIPFKPDVCDELTANMSRQQWREWVSTNIDYIVLCPQLPVPPD